MLQKPFVRNQTRALRSKQRRLRRRQPVPAEHIYGKVGSVRGDKLRSFSWSVLLSCDLCVFALQPNVVLFSFTDMTSFCRFQHRSLEKDDSATAEQFDHRAF